MFECVQRSDAGGFFDQCWRHCKKTTSKHVPMQGHKTHDKLDVDPQRDDDASPMSTYMCMLRPTWMLISALQHKSKYKSNLI